MARRSGFRSPRETSTPGDHGRLMAGLPHRCIPCHYHGGGPWQWRSVPKSRKLLKTTVLWPFLLWPFLPRHYIRRTLPRQHHIGTVRYCRLGRLLSGLPSDRSTNTHVLCRRRANPNPLHASASVMYTPAISRCAPVGPPTRVHMYF